MEGMLLPEDFGVSLLKQRKSKAEQQLKIWLICLSLSGKGTEAQNNVVCANAGMALRP
jgi:anthranilate phosphoribosyltransferase